MPKAFASYTRGLDSPAANHFAITPDDGADLPRAARVIYCHSAGDVALCDAAGTTLTYTLVQGQILPVAAVRVLATGTTATVYGWL